MNRIVKLLGLMLVAVLVLTLLAGCGGQKTAVQPDEQKPPEQQDTSSGAEPLTLPIVKEPLKLTWFISLDAKAAASLKNYDELGVYKQLQEKSGIDIEFQHPPAGQETEQFNLMLASQDLPDIIYWRWPYITGGPAKAIEDGAIIKLNELIDKYAPDYKKALEKFPEARKQVSLDDGTIYIFSSINEPFETRVTGGLQIRKDWLDRLGLQKPATIEDWHNVLKAFKEKDANGNGDPNDEIPFLSQKGGDFKAFATAWGVYRGFYNDNGKVKYGPIEPAYKEFLAEMANWYKEGLIDPEYVSVDGKNFDAKMTGDKGGAYFGAISGGLGKYMNLMKDKNPKFELTPVAAPIGKAGKSYTSNTARKEIVNEGAAFSTKNQHLKESAKLLDYFYTEEGAVARNWGIEGQSYVVENGQRRLTDSIVNNPDGLSIDQAMARYAFPHMSGPGLLDVEARKQVLLRLPQQQDALKIWGGEDDWLLLPPLFPSSSESSRIAAIMNEVNTYEAEMFNKFVMGTEPLDKFDQYVQTIKNMGIEDAIKIMQDAYDRYNAK